MSAEVWHCGHASHMFDISAIRKSPYIHLHFLSEEGAGTAQGYEVMEMCCHACGASLLLYYPAKGPAKESREIRDSFVRSHQQCKQFAPPDYCGNYRSSFTRLDLRNKPKKKPQKRRFFGNKEADRGS